MSIHLSKMILVFVAKVMRGLANILLAMIVAHTIGPKGTGDYFLAVTCVLLVSQVAQFGLHQAAIKYFPSLICAGEKEGVVTMFLVMVILTLFFSSIIAIFVYVYGQWLGAVLFHKAQVGQLLRILAPVIVAWALIRFIVSSWQALGDMKGVAIYENIILPYLLIGGSIFIMLSHGTELELAWATSAVYFSVAVMLVARTPRVIFLGIDESRRKSVFRITALPVPLAEILRFAFPVLAIGIMQQLVVWTDTLMMGIFRTSSEVGIYAAAVRVALVPTLLLYVINTVYAPRISEYCARAEWSNLKDEYKQIVFFMGVITTPIFYCMMLGASWLMRGFGAEFVEGRNILVILLAGQFINVLTGPAGYLMILSGKEKIEGLNIAAMVAVNIFLNVILIPIVGGIGAAVGTAISLALVNIVRAYQNRKVAGVPWFDRRCRKTAMAFLPVIGVGGFFLYLGSASHALIASIVGSLIYVILVGHSARVWARWNIIR